MATTTKRHIQITWLDRDGNAAALGLDEALTTDWTDEECLDAANYRAKCLGFDLERY